MQSNESDRTFPYALSKNTSKGMAHIRSKVAYVIVVGHFRSKTYQDPKKVVS